MLRGLGERGLYRYFKRTVHNAGYFFVFGKVTLCCYRNILTRKTVKLVITVYEKKKKRRGIMKETGVFTENIIV